MRDGVRIEVSATDRDRLERVAADRNSPQKHVWRARIILATGAGCGTAEIMRRAGVSKPSVWRWQRRFMEAGVDGLLRDKTRKPGLPPLPVALVDRVVELTLGEPPGETTHWAGRAMAAATGISLRSMQRIWAAHGLEPHRVRHFKLSKDPALAARLRDAQSMTPDEIYAVSLYLLYANDVIDDPDKVYDQTSFSTITMPNRDGFILPDPRPDTPTDEPCMHDCPNPTGIVGRAAILDVTPDQEGVSMG